MITIIGIFADPNLAEQAGDYLLANEFENENIDVHTPPMPNPVQTG